jgi:dienelactone hydrolase
MQSALLLAIFAVGQADPVFDFAAISKPPLEAKVLKRTEKDELITEEIRFFSHTDFEKRIEIFALFTYPQGAKKLPAFIWNQGGLAQASTYWTEFGAKRGYAVLSIDFPIGGYRSTGGYPINSGVELPENPKKAPIYHGAVALLRAVSYLESRPEVDPKRIGMAGSSWGGFYTTLQAGLDPRIKAAASMFGAGSLGLGNAWWDGSGPNAKYDAPFRQRWSGTLDPALRVPASKTAIGWFTGTNDSFYWLPSVVETYRLAPTPKHLALLPNWNHALDETMDEQVFRWLDIHLKGAEPFLAVSPLVVENREIRFLAEGKRPVKSAEVWVSFGEDAWASRYWQPLAAKRDGDGWLARLAPTKANALVYGCVTDDDGNRSCTPLVSIPGSALAGQMTLPYDGCSMWCDQRGFRKTYHERHSYQLPKLEARGDKTIAKISGQASIGPIFFSPGVNHRLSVEGKFAGASAELVGIFDGKKVTQELNFLDDRILSEFRPPEAKSARLDLVIRGAADGTTFVQRVRFEPIE